jgi:hypothetical protein
MRIPKSLIRLLTYLMVRRRKHEQHAQQHDMACYATSLRIMNLHRTDRADLVFLDVEEVHIVCADVDACPE